MSPGLTAGDSGEFISTAHTLGIAHPPGYPLYIILAKIFTYIPLGNIAFRVNLMSVLCASIAGIFLFLLLEDIFHSDFFSFAGALLFISTRTFWSQATVAEVYTLNIALVLLFFIFLYRNNLYASSFLLGTGLANHHTFLLFIPILLLVLFIKIKKNEENNRWIFLIKISFCFLIGISLYLFILIRAFKSPPINWGNPTTFVKLIQHFMRKEYDPFSNIYTWQKFFIHISHYLKQLQEQFFIFLWILVPFGWYAIWQTRKNSFFISIIIFLLTTLGFILLVNYQPNQMNFYLFEVFYLPSYIIFLYWILEGFYFLAEMMKKYIRFSFELISAVIIIFSFVYFYKNYKNNNSRQNFANYYYGEDLLTTLPKNAYIITKGDNQIFALFYFKLVENKRQDIIIDPGIKKYIFKDTILKQDNENTFFAEKIDAIITPNTKIIPYGLVYTYASANKTDSGIKFWNYYKNSNLEQKQYFKDYLTMDIMVKYFLQYGENLYAAEKNDKALVIYKKAVNIGAFVFDEYFNFGLRLFNQLKYNEAISELKKVIYMYPSYAKSYNYLGIAYAQKEEFISAIKNLKRAVEIDSKNSNYIYNLAIAYFRSGDLLQAEKNLNHVLELNPGNSEAKKMLLFIKK